MKYTLAEEYDYDFTLVGISCHAKDYRICWAINHGFGFDLEKQSSDLELFLDKEIEVSHHSLYAFYDEEDQNDYYLIGNRGLRGFLIPEQRQADYMLMIKGALPVDGDEMAVNLKQLDHVLTAFPIDVQKLKSKKNLIF